MIKFTTSNPTPYEYHIPLPMLMTHFMEPAELDEEGFHTRWERLAAPGLEASEVVPTVMT